MNSDRDDDAWFAPKSFGYGAGLPVRWQGWAMLGGHVAAILLGTWLLRDRPAPTLAWVLLVGLLPLPIYAAKTRGGFHWRWGRRD